MLVIWVGVKVVSKLVEYRQLTLLKFGEYGELNGCYIWDEMKSCFLEDEFWIYMSTRWRCVSFFQEGLGCFPKVAFVPLRDSLGKAP